MNCCECIKLCECMEKIGQLEAKLKSVKDVAIAINNFGSKPFYIEEMAKAIIRISEDK